MTKELPQSTLPSARFPRHSRGRVPERVLNSAPQFSADVSAAHIMSRTLLCLVDSIMTASFFPLGLGRWCRVLGTRTAGCLVHVCGGMGFGKGVKIGENVVSEGGKFASRQLLHSLGKCLAGWVCTSRPSVRPYFGLFSVISVVA